MRTSPELVAWANLEAETNIISCMLTDKETVSYCVKTLEPKDFYEVGFQKLFKAMKDLWDKNKPIDLISVSAEGYDMGNLAELISNNFPGGHKNQVNIIKTLSLKRQAVIAAKNIITELSKKVFDKPQEVTQYITGKLDLSLPKLEQTPEDTQTIALEVMDYIESVATEKVKPILYGIRDVDFLPGDFGMQNLR